MDDANTNVDSSREQDPDHINLLVSSLDGLGLPKTANFVFPSNVNFNIARSRVLGTLPHQNLPILIRSADNRKPINYDGPLRSLLPKNGGNFILLRLSTGLRGGKGGFGSQLRAAGGRMSSKRKKKQSEDNSSNRNLDGRRLRTVKEAKALAEYLSLKPEMERRGKEQKRKRWEQVIRVAKQKEEESRNGAKVLVDGVWSDEREEAGERARNAVLTAINSGLYHDNLGATGNNSAPAEGNQVSQSKASQISQPDITKSVVGSSKAYIGFDEDDFGSETSDDSNSATLENIATASVPQT